MGRPKLADPDVYVHHATALAYLVSDDGKRENAVWIPRSVADLDPPFAGSGRYYVMTLPEHMAQEKGLI